MKTTKINLGNLLSCQTIETRNGAQTVIQNQSTIETSQTNEYGRIAQVVIDKRLMDIQFVKPEKATLVLKLTEDSSTVYPEIAVEVDGSFAETIECSSTSESYYFKNGKYYISLEKYLEQSISTIILRVLMTDGATFKFYATGDDALHMNVIYNDVFVDESQRTKLEKASILVDPYTGKDTIISEGIQDDELGISVNTILNPESTENVGYGKGVKLNLQETLSKNADGKYIYKDAFGKEYLVNESFYYVDSQGERVDIQNKENLSISSDGKIIYTENNVTYDVVREELSEEGIIAITELEDVKNAELYNSLSAEEKDVYLRKKQLQNAIYDCVLVSETEETEIEENSDIDQFCSKILNNTESDVFTKSEKLNLEALKDQIVSLEKQYKEENETVTGTGFVQTQIEDIRKSSKSNAEMLISNKDTEYGKSLLEIHKLIKEGEHEEIYAFEVDSNSIVNIKNGENIVFPTENDNGGLEDKIRGYVADGFLCVSNSDLTTLKSLLEQRTMILRQTESAKEQIDMLLSRGKENRQQILEAYTELKSIRQQMSVRYIFDGQSLKGFNEYGNLVAIYGENGKTTVVYEEYGSGEEKKQRVSKRINSEGKGITLHYDSLGLLNEAINSQGEIIKYEYDSSSNLIKIIYSDKQELTFEKGTDNLKVRNRNKHAQITYTDDKVSSLEYFATSEQEIEGEEKPRITICSLEKIDFECGQNAVVINNYLKTSEIYEFYEQDKPKSYSKIRNGKYIKAEKYVYVGNGRYNISSVQENNLYGDAISYDDMCQSTVTFDSFNRVATESITNKTIHISDGVATKQDLVTTYTYNEKNQVVKAVTNEKMYVDIESPLKEYNHIELLEHNQNGQLVKKQSYTEGEEAINGINIEEHVYDKKGYEIKKITYNSLDPSSKLYGEVEVNEKGQVVAELDLLGKNRTIYEYFANTNTVCSKKYPNGSKYSVGNDYINGNTAITQSTLDGTENSVTKLYTNGLLTKVKDQVNEYEYKYEPKGRVAKIKQNGNELATYVYTDTDTEQKVEETLSSGLVRSVTKGANSETVQISNIRRTSNVYTVVTTKRDDGKPIKKTLYKTNELEREINYEYDNYGNLIKATLDFSILNFGIYGSITENYYYDNLNRLVGKTVNGIGDNMVEYEYAYSKDSQSKLESLFFEGIEILPKYDCLGRKTEKEIKLSNTPVTKEKISYLKYGDHATLMPNQISYFARYNDNYLGRDNLRYTYDKMGNVSQIYKNGALVCEYKYDTLGRLVRENNKELNRTELYEYDSVGNMVSKMRTSFTLEPKREIVITNPRELKYKYTEDGKLLTYGGLNYFNVTDMEFGYPSIWKKRYSIVWTLQHKMMSFGDNYFEYDVEGRRTQKNDITYIYDVNDKLVKQSNGIEYLYDNEGCIGFKYTTTENDVSVTNTYLYRKDIFGNVIEILDTNGGTVVKYVYDAWGNHKVLNPDGTENTTDNFIGNINPIRYRSYYYDTETGLYYLNARYYDPEVCRFISPDDINYLDPETIGGTNLYAYCNNNPVMYADPSGHFLISLFVGLVASFVIGTTASAVSQYVQYGGNINWLQACIDGLFAVGSTLLAYTGIGLIGSITLGASLGLLQYTIDSAVFHDDFTWSGALIATGLGAIGGVLGGRGAKHFKSIGSNLDETGRRGVKAILTAFDKYGMGTAYQKTINLWGRRVGNSISKSISQNFTKSTLIIWGTTVANYKASYWLNKINWRF